MTVSIRMNTVSTRTSLERPRSMPAWSRSVQYFPVLTRLIHGRTRMSSNKQDLSLLRRYPWSFVTGGVLSGINPCTIRIHPCSSIENTRTRMVPVLTRSLRWLHGTSRFIHGTSTVDFRPGPRTTPGACTVCTRFITVCHWPPRTFTDHYGLIVRDDQASHPWMCKRGFRFEELNMTPGSPNVYNLNSTFLF
jgi:hypothetical protein